MTTDVLVRVRQRLFSLAYRLIGDAQAADDVVQDAQERWARRTEEVHDPRSWLERVTVNLALDYLKSARVRREMYVGPWLPEALVSEAVLLRDTLEEREALSLAFLAVLERLSPLERAVFVLIESFDYTPGEVGAIIDRSEPAVRQLLHRARAHVCENRPRFATDRQAHLRILQTFLRAVREGDTRVIESLLVTDARAVTDGGGNAKAALKIIAGANRVARFVGGAVSRARGIALAILDVNGAPSLVASMDGSLVSVGQLETDGARIFALHAISNPEKLGRLAAPRACHVTIETAVSS